jgi:hypothetical protein
MYLTTNLYVVVVPTKMVTGYPAVIKIVLTMDKDQGKEELNEDS